MTWVNCLTKNQLQVKCIFFIQNFVILDFEMYTLMICNEIGSFEWYMCGLILKKNGFPPKFEFRKYELLEYES